MHLFFLWPQEINLCLCLSPFLFNLCIGCWDSFSSHTWKAEGGRLLWVSSQCGLQTGNRDSLWRQQCGLQQLCGSGWESSARAAFSLLLCVFRPLQSDLIWGCASLQPFSYLYTKGMDLIMSQQVTLLDWIIQDHPASERDSCHLFEYIIKKIEKP